MASNFNGAAAWAAREAQKSKEFDGAAAWAERESAKALARTADITNRMLAGSDIMGRTPVLTPVTTPKAQTQAETSDEDIPSGGRVGNALKSIGNTLISAPAVLVDSVKQHFANNEAEAADPELTRLRNQYADIGIQISELERTDPWARETQEWKDLDEQFRAIEAQISARSDEVAKPVSPDTWSMQTLQKAAQQKEAALEGTGKVGRWVGENLISVGQNAVLLPLGLINPAVPIGAMATVAAGSKAAELSTQGAAPGEALLRGVVSGGIEALTEKIPVDNLLDMVKVGGRSAIKNLLKQAGTEAGEESVSYVLNYVADKAAGDPNATFTLKELASAAGSGAFSGSLMGGGATLIGNAVNSSVPSKVNIDNANASGYTDNTNGGVVNGSQLHGTSGEGVREGPVGDATGVEMAQGRNGGQGDLRNSGVVLLSDKSKSTLIERGVVPVEYSNSMGNAAFSSALDQARNANQKNGWAVSPQSVEDLDRYGAKTYLSSNASSGFGVTSDGDIVGVFANKFAGAPKGTTVSLIPQAISEGGIKLDCYGEKLVDIYSRFGFVPVARVEFNAEYANPGWTPEKGTPYVYVMMHNGDSADTVVENIGKYQSYTKDQLDSLPTYGKDSYDEAIAYRDSLIEERKNSSNPFVPPMPPTPEPVLPPIFKDGKVVNPDDSVGAAPAGFDPYSGALNEFGAIEPGENPARVVDVPLSTDGTNRVSRTARTAMEAEATPDSMVGDVAEDVMNGESGLTYIPITNTETTERARQIIERDGYQATLLNWSKQVSSGKVSADLTAMGALLYNAAANSGNTKQALDILSDYASMARSGAQAVQAARILKTLTPEGKLYYAQKSVEKIQQELDQKYGAGKYNISISDNLANAYLKAETDEARKAALDDIYKDVAKQIPTTFAEKWNAWRYFAMLANPRTHIRNVVGNAAFAPVRMVKNAIATVGEGVVSYLSPNGIERTKAPLNYANESDRNLVKAAFADAANVQDQLLGEGKYDNAANTINQNKRIFAIGPLEAMRKMNSAALDVEDAVFSKPAYAGALAGYLKANKATVETASPELLDKARAYAVREAQKATYRDANALSDFISNLRYRGNNPVGKAANVLMEGVLPFRRTPANILARGVEYSPIGLTKSLTSDLVKVKKGEMTAAEAIDNISAGLTGTGLTALGIFLAAQGLVTGGASGSDEEQKMADLTGKQNYAVTIGNKNYTLDWLAPEAMPFFVGVELYNQFSDKADGSGRAMEDLWNALGSISSPMLEMSMLSGVQDLLESIANAEGWETIPTVLSTAATNYVSQAFPTLLGQIERVGENERETTFVDRTSPLTNDLQYTLGKTANKIPLYDFQQIPFIDAWGRTEDTGNTGEKIVNNMLAPWYSSKENATEADKEIMRLLDEGYTGVAPDRVKQSYEVTYKNDPEDEENQKRYMTADEYVEFSTIKGQKSYDIVSEMINSDVYKGMTDEQKSEAIKLAYTYANHLASDEITDGKHTADKYVANAQVAKEQLGLSEAEYLMLYKQYGANLMNGDDIRKAYASGIDVMDYLDYGSNKPKYNTDGKQGYTIAETAEAIKKSGLTKDQQILLWLIEKPEWGEKAAEAGVTPSVYADFKVATIGKSKKEDILSAINRMGISKAQKDKLYYAAGYAESKINDAPWR